VIPTRPRCSVSNVEVCSRSGRGMWTFRSSRSNTSKMTRGRFLGRACNRFPHSVPYPRPERVPSPHVGKESQPTAPAEAWHYMLSARTDPGWQGTPRVPRTRTVLPCHSVGQYARLRPCLDVVLVPHGLLVVHVRELLGSALRWAIRLPRLPISIAGGRGPGRDCRSFRRRAIALAASPAICYTTSDCGAA
jgi:hypothetical protein